VLYNSSFGSNIVGNSILFGEEPWNFYFKNLILNFNIALPLYFIYPITFYSSQNYKKQGYLQLKSALYLSSIVWLFLMTSQPHKEERFMYIIYPFITLYAGKTIKHLKLKFPIASTILITIFCVLSVSRSV